MPTACRGTEKRKGGDKKARQLAGSFGQSPQGASEPDCVVADAVDLEPVSNPANSLLTGKLTGNFAKFSVPQRI
jgi:hypothetical protein